MSRFAATPKPPYYVVTFSSLHRGPDNGYGATAQRMAELAATMPGYLGMESTRDAQGFGITLAFFDSEQSIANWKRQSEHLAAQERGRKEWYEHYELRVAKVERAYGFSAKKG